MTTGEPPDITPWLLPSGDLSSLNAERPRLEAEPKPDLVAKYELFKEKLNPKVDVIYHPCCNKDISPSAAFSNSRVVYVDIDKECVEVLKRSGVEAHLASALEFDPGDVDVLIMLNPVISPKVPSSHVVANGFVLSNDYHKTASSLHQNDQYKLRAMIRVSRSGELVFDTENIEDYWKGIDTEEEFKNAPFNWGAANYAMAVKVVEAITGKRENILTEYRKIIDMAREQSRQSNARMLAELPQCAELIGDPDKEEVLMFKHDGREFVISTVLPRKKGTVDDVFVFQKVK